MPKSKYLLQEYWFRIQATTNNNIHHHHHLHLHHHHHHHNDHHHAQWRTGIFLAFPKPSWCSCALLGSSWNFWRYSMGPTGFPETSVRNYGYMPLNSLAPELLFFYILAHSVYKMWIIQEPNKLALWNKLHFEEKKTESIRACLKYSVPIFVE